MSDFGVSIFGLLTVSTGFAIGVGVAHVFPPKNSDFIVTDMIRMGLFGCAGAVLLPSALVAVAVLSK